ncbi:MAG: T9SS type A sorting domain-containing protein, partial [Bacteroidota bacterium]
AGFDLNLSWDTTRFSLASVTLTDEAVLRPEDLSYTTTGLRLFRDPQEAIRTPAVLTATPQAELCFHADAPGSVSNLAFTANNDDGISGYDTTGTVVAVPTTGLGTGTLEQSGTTAVFGPATHPSLKLFPNPGDGRLRIEPLSGVQSLQVAAWSENGQLVYRGIVSGTDLDLSHLPTGKYLMRTVAGSKTYVNRLVITH